MLVSKYIYDFSTFFMSLCLTLSQKLTLVKVIQICFYFLFVGCGLWDVSPTTSGDVHTKLQEMLILYILFIIQIMCVLHRRIIVGDLLLTGRLKSSFRWHWRRQWNKIQSSKNTCIDFTAFVQLFSGVWPSK